MANEATLSEESGLNPIRFEVATASNISKGTILKLSANYAVVASAAQDIIAGIAAADHKAGDGSEIAVYVPGQMNVFECTIVSKGVVAGNMVGVSGANFITSVGVTGVSTGLVLGKVLETSTTVFDTVRVLV